MYCMYVCMYVCMYMCMYVCMYEVYVCMYVYMYIYVYYLYLYLYLHLCLYLYDYMSISIYLYLYVYISIYLYIYIPMYLYIYTRICMYLYLYLYLYRYIYRCVYVSSPISYLPILLGIFIEDPSPGQASLHAAISKEARSGEFRQILTGRQGDQLRLCGFLKMCMRVFKMNLARSTRHEDAPNQKNWCPTRKNYVTNILQNDHLAHFGWVCHGCRSSCLRTRFKA